jgi:hypothetical protein
MSRNKLSGAQIWAAPIALGVLSGVGLISALLSEDFGDWLAWAALVLPVAVCARYSLKSG